MISVGVLFLVALAIAYIGFDEAAKGAIIGAIAGAAVGLASGDDAVERRQRALIGAGVVKGARVAVLIGNRPEWVEAFFAAAMAYFVADTKLSTPGEQRAALVERLRENNAHILVLDGLEMLRSDGGATPRGSLREPTPW